MNKFWVPLAVLLGLLPLHPAAAQLPGVEPLELTGLKVMGYADRLSAQPGQDVGFMVSTTEPRYRVDLVRLIHGDADPRGPGFREEVITSPVAGEYPGRVQRWDPGSYAIVENAPELGGSFTVQAWVFPTLPESGVQAVVSRWDGDRERGWGLFVDETGSLALWLADGSGEVERVSTGVAFPKPVPFNGAFHAWTWFFVAAVYDAEEGEVRLYQEPMQVWPAGVQPTEVVREVTTVQPDPGEVPLLISGYSVTDPDGKRFVEANYNGKLEAPRIYRRALSPGEIDRLRRGDAPSDGLVAAWDFSREIRSRQIVDVSGNGHHARTVNMPKRAVTGRLWDRQEINFNNAPDQYGAIHFTEDALEDAGWEEAFRFTVPANLKSGVYAMRVRAGDDEDHIPFYVRPGPNQDRAPIAFLIPTFTYVSYANIGNACDACRAMPTKGTYNRHADGTGIAYSSALRPILDMRPRTISRWSGHGGSTPRHFAAELYMIDWLEQKGFEYDVITDGDLHAEGVDLLRPYRTVITGSHPEYVSAAILNGLETYLDEGGRVMYMAGNGFYWVTSVDEENPNLIEVRKWGGTRSTDTAPGEYYHSTTGELGGLWRTRGRHPQKLVGVGFSSMGWDRNATYARSEASLAPEVAFIFEGVDPDAIIGDFESLGLGRGAAGDEIDRADPALGSPPGTTTLATANDFSSRFQLVIEDLLETSPNRGGGQNPDVRSDIVYFRYPNEGAVFAAGSISWFSSLSGQDYQNNVSRITENVLRAFSTAETLPIPRN